MGGKGECRSLTDGEHRRLQRGGQSLLGPLGLAPSPLLKGLSHRGLDFLPGTSPEGCQGSFQRALCCRPNPVEMLGIAEGILGWTPPATTVG